MEDWVKSFLEAIRENTQALQDVKLEAKLQTLALKDNRKMLEDLKDDILSDFKRPIMESLESTEGKIDALDKDMKIQWAILGGGFLSVVTTIIVAIVQLS